MEEFNRGVEDLERMEGAYEMFDDLQDLKKRAARELTSHAFPIGKLRRLPSEKLRLVMEEEINFVGNKMYERLKLKLQEVPPFSILGLRLRSDSVVDLQDNSDIDRRYNLREVWVREGRNREANWGVAATSQRFEEMQE